MAQRQLDWISEDVYRESEELSLEKHEWFQRKISEMPRGDYNHTALCSSLSCATANALRGKACIALNSQMRVKIEANGLHTYPDALIFCPPSRFEGAGDNILLTPSVIFEVLSQSTQSYDRTRKFDAYKLIETLTDYVLIEQNEIRVEHFRRTPLGWLHVSFSSRDAVLALENVEIELPLSEIYEELDFSEPADAPQIPPRREDD